MTQTLHQVIAGATRRMDGRTPAKIRRGSQARGITPYRSMTWKEANRRILALEKWERRQAKRERAKIRAVGDIGVKLYAYLCRVAVNRKGRLDDITYAALASAIGVARSAIVAAAKRLRDHGWLNWARQYEPTGATDGPAWAQCANFFWLEAPLRALAALGIRYLEPPAPDDFDAIKTAAEKENREIDLADSRLGRALERLDPSRRSRETSTRSDPRGR